MGFFKTIIIIQSILGNVTGTKNILLEPENNFKSDIATAFREIADHVFKNERANINIIAAYSDKSLDDHLLKIISDFDSNIKVMIETSEKLVEIKQGQRSTVIIVLDSIDSYQGLLKQLKDRKKFNRAGYFIIVFRSATLDQLEIIFGSLWKLHVYNIGVISDDVANLIKLSTFLPFEDHCDDISPKVINSFDTNKKAWKSKNFFPRKFKNLRQCNLIVGTFETEPSVIRKMEDGKIKKIYGTEIDLMRGISLLLNFTLIFKFYSQESGNVFDNGSATGLMEKAINGDVNVIMGFLSLQYSRAKFLSISKAFANVPIAIVIPPGAVITSFHKLFYPYSWIVWILIITMLVIAILVIITSERYSRRSYDFLVGSNIRNPTLNMLTVILGFTQKILPGRNFSRFTLMNFMLFFLVMRTCYQGILFKNLQIVLRGKEVSSIDEMIEKDFKFYIYETLEKRTEGYAFYHKRVIIKLSEQEYFRHMTLDPSFNGAVFNYLTQVLYINQLHHKEFSYRICKDLFTNNQMIFYFQKDFYLLNEFNGMITALHENGVIKFWRSKYVDSRYTNRNDDSIGPTPLRFYHLRGCFELFTGGLIICVSVFSLEMLAKHVLIFKKVFE